MLGVNCRVCLSWAWLSRMRAYLLSGSFSAVLDAASSEQSIVVRVRTGAESSRGGKGRTSAPARTGSGANRLVLTFAAQDVAG